MSGLASSTTFTLLLTGPSATFTAPVNPIFVAGFDTALNAYWSVGTFSLKSTQDNGVTRTYTYQTTFSASFDTQKFRTPLNGGSARFLAYSRDNAGHYFYVLGQGSVTLVP